MTPFFITWWFTYPVAPGDALAILSASVFLLQLVFFFRDALGISTYLSSRDLVIASSVCDQEELWCGLFITPLLYITIRVTESMATLIASFI